ncbi:MAG: dNTP triphosphohydrolase [Bacteroidaceae bacterium]|nr:dNTP triphosphohydrolase [Bacteroidaceae bacterium]MBR5847087.1 dNTP triphosphohydrolase [Bacteroidaceae bacterium]
MDWRTLISPKRLGMESYGNEGSDDRSDFLRDYDRLIFSAPFRRLQNKTQVFPLPGSVFVHNRLTHSLEVACVGRSLGNKVSRAIVKKRPELADSLVGEMGNIVSAACLAHDLGNPPFGHSGERAISTYFSEGKGGVLRDQLSPMEWEDIVHFEGNANAFRLLTHQFNGRRKGGFALTYSTLASIVKYPYSSCYAGGKSKFGFFQTEAETFRTIADELGLIRLSGEGEPLRYCRHPLVFLVEAADDICYQLMDIEDAFKLKILTLEETVALLTPFVQEHKRGHLAEVLGMVSDQNEQIAYLRSKVIGILIDECVDAFMRHEEEILSGTFSEALIKHTSDCCRQAYKHCSEVAVKKIYRSRDVLDIELAGFRIINTLIELMIDAVTHPDKAYSQLLIDRVSSQYDLHAPTLFGKVQAVFDYLSGMTDVFALDLYRKINGNSLPAV